MATPVTVLPSSTRDSHLALAAPQNEPSPVLQGADRGERLLADWRAALELAPRSSALRATHSLKRNVEQGPAHHDDDDEQQHHDAGRQRFGGTPTLLNHVGNRAEHQPDHDGKRTPALGKPAPRARADKGDDEPMVTMANRAALPSTRSNWLSLHIR
jgi:hypothetical protein